MNKHTPGPYRVRKWPDHACNKGKRFQAYDVLAKDPSPDTEHEIILVSGTSNAANARLFAAAPDLLAACQTIAAGMGNMPLNAIGPDGVHGINDGKQRAIYLRRFVELARAAIASADAPAPREADRSEA